MARTRTFATCRSIAASSGQPCVTSGERSIVRCVTVPPMRRLPLPSDPLDRPERRDRLHVDEMAERGESELHQQQQLRAARVQRGVIAVLLDERGRLVDRGRPMDREGGETRHTRGAGPDELTLGVHAGGRGERGQRRIQAGADLDARAEVDERAPERGQARDHQHRARRGAHVADADDVARALARRELDAVALPRVVAHLRVGQAIGDADRRTRRPTRSPC